MIIYPPSYRIPVKLGDVTFWLSPLTFGAKQEVHACVKMKAGEEVGDVDRRLYTVLKLSLRDVEGLKLPDGTPFVLEFDPSGAVTEDAMAVVLQADQLGNLALQAWKFFNDRWEEKVEGVEVDLGAARPAKKNSD